MQAAPVLNKVQEIIPGDYEKQLMLTEDAIGQELAKSKALWCSSKMAGLTHTTGHGACFD